MIALVYASTAASFAGDVLPSRTKTRSNAGQMIVRWPKGLKPDEFFCLKHNSTVTNDNTISFDGNRLQIPPGPHRISYARARVEVQQRLDGSLVICYNGRTLATYQPATQSPVRVGKFTPAPAAQTPAPAKTQSAEPVVTKTRLPYKPPPDHPWRLYPISPKAARSARKPTHTERQNKPATS